MAESALQCLVRQQELRQSKIVSVRVAIVSDGYVFLFNIDRYLNSTPAAYAIEIQCESITIAYMLTFQRTLRIEYGTYFNS